MHAGRARGGEQRPQVRLGHLGAMLQLTGPFRERPRAALGLHAHLAVLARLFPCRLQLGPELRNLLAQLDEPIHRRSAHVRVGEPAAPPPGLGVLGALAGAPALPLDRLPLPGSHGRVVQQAIGTPRRLETTPGHKRAHCPSDRQWIGEAQFPAELSWRRLKQFALLGTFGDRGEERIDALEALLVHSWILTDCPVTAPVVSKGTASADRLDSRERRPPAVRLPHPGSLPRSGRAARDTDPRRPRCGRDQDRTARRGRRHPPLGTAVRRRGRRVLPVAQQEQAVRDGGPEVSGRHRGDPPPGGRLGRPDRELPAGTDGRPRPRPRRPPPCHSSSDHLLSDRLRRGGSRGGRPPRLRHHRPGAVRPDERDRRARRGAGEGGRRSPRRRHRAPGGDRHPRRAARARANRSRETHQRVAVRCRRCRDGEPGGQPSARRRGRGADGHGAPEHLPVPGVPRVRSPVHRRRGERPVVPPHVRGGGASGMGQPILGSRRTRIACDIARS